MFVLLDCHRWCITLQSAPASETLLFRDEWTILPRSPLRKPKSKGAGVVLNQLFLSQYYSQYYLVLTKTYNKFRETTRLQESNNSQFQTIVGYRCVSYVSYILLIYIHDYFKKSVWLREYSLKKKHYFRETWGESLARRVRLQKRIIHRAKKTVSRIDLVRFLVA